MRLVFALHFYRKECCSANWSEKACMAMESNEDAAHRINSSKDCLFFAQYIRQHSQQAHCKFAQ
jgi:hypothetical protein